MKAYFKNAVQENLVSLSSLHDTPGYEVIEGDPRCSMRLDVGSSSTSSRLGIWSCTPGTFRCIERGDELQTVIEGKLSLIMDDGNIYDFEPGDSFYTKKGERVTWKIVETVKKVFFTYDSANSSVTE